MDMVIFFACFAVLVLLQCAFFAVIVLQVKKRIYQDLQDQYQAWFGQPDQNQPSEFGKVVATFGDIVASRFFESLKMSALGARGGRPVKGQEDAGGPGGMLPEGVIPEQLQSLMNNPLFMILERFLGRGTAGPPRENSPAGGGNGAGTLKRFN